jgi:large subunit ribosomal protein L4
MEAKIYNQTGKETGSIQLPENIFGVAWNADLVHQVAVSMQSNEREPVAHTKDRGQVSGGGTKPWRQKGTGRARHGSSRSPIWRHGGVTHGPNNLKNFSRKVNKKMKAKALFALLSKKYRDGEVLFVDAFSFSEPKAKRAKEVLTTLGGIKGYEMLGMKRKNAAYIGVDALNANLEKSFGNFGNVEVDTLANVNPLDLLKYKFLVVSNPEVTIKVLEKKLAPSAAKANGRRISTPRTFKGKGQNGIKKESEKAGKKKTAKRVKTAA